MDQLLKEMTIDHIPVALGGKFELFNEPFEFDVSPTSTLYYEGCEKDSVRYVEKRKEFERHDKEEYCYYYRKTSFFEGLSGASLTSSEMNDSPEDNNDWFDQVFRDVGEEDCDIVSPSSVEVSTVGSHSPSVSDHHHPLPILIKKYYYLLFFIALPSAVVALLSIYSVYFIIDDLKST